MSDSVRHFASSLATALDVGRAREFCQANARTLALGAAAAAVLLHAARSCYRAFKLPPGPLGLPILGRLPWLDMAHIEESQEAMRQKYGDIYSYRLGNRLMVIVSSHQLLKEMLSEDVFSGRQVPQAVTEAAKGCGILFTEGPSWIEQRRVALRVLRDFGFARSESVEFINGEIDLLLEQLEKAPGQLKTIDLFNALTNSVIAMLVFGRRYANEDQRYANFIEDSKILFEVGLIDSLPFLFPYLAAPLKLAPSVRKLVETVEKIQAFVQAEIAQRQALLDADPDAEGSCLCDAYIQERRRAEARGDSETFRSFQLVRVGLELFVAGTDTTARTLEWLVVHMAAFPDVQTRVQEEIHQVVGTERRPQTGDKAALHYTQAVIDESLRLASLALNAVSHRALADTYFRGHLIPSDAAIVPFLFGLHRDPRVWKRPNEFYPEHFLTGDGRYAPSKALLPFGIGKRACPGESLARLEVYLTFTAIVQRYRIRFSAGYETQVGAILRGTSGLAREVGDYRVDFARII